MSSKIFVRIHTVLRKIENKTIEKKKLPMCPTAHVPYCPCALLPHVPHPQGPPSVSVVLTKVPFTHVPHCPCALLPMCHIAHVSKRCQVVKKMSKSQTHRLWRRFTKKINWHMRFTHIDVNFDIKYEGHQNCSKTLSMHILRVFGDHHMWHQKLTSKCVNLIMSIYFFCEPPPSACVWFFDIWHLFDNLTSFWQFDIFLTFWFLF